ncbi:glycoside hydrolase family 32 protein [Antribacter sp. KLBMP9083]|uniref:Glycoside hydrolase family 32 protein n=1 Tax=Antribacter soli TaxID=2910976 RepID=A0AA41QD95_9MICO|nr:glycoside hydrolase family 32 protein [Antribacter soli]MCF4121058.1 glycoside hydrolase family 32 protein [Antribacter soli]
MTTIQPSRRALLLGAAGGLAAGAAGAMLGPTSAAALASTRPASSRTGGPHVNQTYRPAYHLSVPDNWKNDPQRPIYLDGEYLYYYLYNADYLTGGGGTAWRLATTRDHVSFIDQGVAIPKFTTANGDCWSGCLVVDHENTAGYGPGAVVALVTQAPAGRQAQYLWYSTDRGRTFQPGPIDPVLPNPGVNDFRDPKVIWDDARSRWFMANAEGNRIGFYASDNLHRWERVGEFVRDDIGLLECPDVFSMRAADGTDHWVLGVSANGKGRGLPATFAYWTGSFDGSTFVPDGAEPQWLDRGFDFYGAVTYPHHRADGTEDPGLRHALGWANFWDYPHNAPSLVTDGYNGDDMIVRDVRLERDDDGTYYLASQPTAALADHVTVSHELGDVRVDGTLDLDVTARAYELSCDLVWDPANRPGNIGFELCRAPGGGRHVAAGAYLDGGFAFVNRRPSFNPSGGESQTPVDRTAGRLRIRVLVDHASVELFVGDGRIVHSHRVFPLAGDNHIRLFSHGGMAVFEGLTVRELEVS